MSGDAMVHRMSLKHTVFHRVNRPSTRRILELAGTAVASVQGGKAKITYDPQSGGWMKRTQGGVTLMPYPYGMSVEQCLSFATDVFLRDYMIRPGDVVLDIGAGIGTEALPFAHLAGDAGKVISVEAHPATFAMLERVCRLNDLKNVELVQAAVMDSDEPVMISDMREGFCQENRVGDPGGIEVPGVTIADLVAKFNLDRIDFIKMNIEGAEVPALLGARDVLPIVRHAAIGCHDFLSDETGEEFYRTMETVRALLQDAGFTVRRTQDPRPWAAGYLFAAR